MSTATTTPDDVLAKLQAAWNRAPKPAPVPVLTIAEVLDPRCGVHNDPAGWDSKPDRYKREGWRTVHCRHCGRFIGYQPPQQAD